MNPWLLGRYAASMRLIADTIAGEWKVRRLIVSSRTAAGKNDKIAFAATENAYV